MEWSDERYVKLYVRDTLTWRSWKWETRTVFLHLLKGRLDGSGFIETGAMDPVDALTLQLELPREVVAVGLEQLLGCGTATLVDRAVLIPKYLEAQEARKSEAQKKRDFRERTIARRQAADSSTPHVPTKEPTGTEVDPPDQTRPAQPEKLAGKKPPADPRLKPLTDSLAATFRKERGHPYKHGGAKDAQALKSLLPIATDAEISRRWVIGLRASGWTSVSSFAQLSSKWNEIGAPQQAKGAAWQTPGATDWENRPKSFLEELAGE